MHSQNESNLGSGNTQGRPISVISPLVRLPSGVAAVFKLIHNDGGVIRSGGGGHAGALIRDDAVRGRVVN